MSLERSMGGHSIEAPDTKQLDQYRPRSRLGELDSLSALGVGGPPLTHWQTGGWGPTYKAVHTQCTEPWADFFEVLQLLM
jgi:hypothetical protein